MVRSNQKGFSGIIIIFIVLFSVVAITVLLIQYRKPAQVNNTNNSFNADEFNQGIKNDDSTQNPKDGSENVTNAETKEVPDSTSDSDSGLNSESDIELLNPTLLAEDKQIGALDFNVIAGKDLKSNQIIGSSKSLKNSLGMGCPFCFKAIKHDTLPMALIDTTFEASFKNIPLFVNWSDDLEFRDISAEGMAMQKTYDTSRITPGNGLFDIEPFTQNDKGFSINYVESDYFKYEDLELNYENLLKLTEDELQKQNEKYEKELRDTNKYVDVYCTLDPRQMGQGSYEGCHGLIKVTTLSIY